MAHPTNPVGRTRHDYVFSSKKAIYKGSVYAK